MTFETLVTGWNLSPRHRYVTDPIVSSNSILKGHFSNYHRFSSHAEWNRDELWELSEKTLHFGQYGLHGSLRFKTNTGLYYTIGKDRLLRFVLSQDSVGGRPTRKFYGTDLSISPQGILSDFSVCWVFEVTYSAGKMELHDAPRDRSGDNPPIPTCHGPDF